MNVQWLPGILLISTGAVSTAWAAKAGESHVLTTPNVKLEVAPAQNATLKTVPLKVAPVKVAPQKAPSSPSIKPALVKTAPSAVKVVPTKPELTRISPKPLRVNPAPAATVNTRPTIDTGALENARTNAIKARIDPNLHQDLRGVLENAPNLTAVPGGGDIGSNRGDLTHIPGGIGGGNDSTNQFPGSSKKPNDALVNVIPGATTPRASHANAGPAESGGKSGHFLVPTPREAMAGADNQSRGRRGGGGSGVMVDWDGQPRRDQGRSTGMVNWDGTPHRRGQDSQGTGIIQTWDGHQQSESNSQVVVTKWQDTGETHKYVDGVEVPDRPQSDQPKVDPAGNPDPTGDADSPLADALRQRFNLGPDPDLTFKNPNDDTTDPDGRDGAAKSPSGPRIILSRDQLTGDPSLSNAYQGSGGELQPLTAEDADPGPGARPPGME
jgi:hypothetical protein